MSDGSTKEIRVLDGESYSSALLNAADEAQKRGADGAIGADDANAILEAKESDGELRKKTIDFIRGHYKFTKDAEPVFQAGNEKPAKLKKSRTKSSEKVMPPPRTDKPQRKRKASSKLLEAQEDEESQKNPKFEEETKKRKKNKRGKKVQVYCICRKPYNQRAPMIACDTCDEWYHLKCVEMSPEDAQNIETYKCERCERGEPPLRDLDGGGEADDQDDAEQDLEEAEPDDEPRQGQKKKAPKASPDDALAGAGELEDGDLGDGIEDE